jgi:hypothetical protein
VDEGKKPCNGFIDRQRRYSTRHALLFKSTFYKASPYYRPMGEKSAKLRFALCVYLFAELRPAPYQRNTFLWKPHDGKRAPMPEFYACVIASEGFWRKPRSKATAAIPLNVSTEHRRPPLPSPLTFL